MSLRPVSAVIGVVTLLLMALACGPTENAPPDEEQPDPTDNPPEPQTFSVSGSVEGLIGSGLVLRNNGIDELAVDREGSFTFATALPDGGEYEVTVHVHPVDPEQICEVTDGEGLILGEPVTSVLVTCRNPEAPQDCLPEERRCTGDVVEICGLTGAWELHEECDPNTTCSEGACLSQCELAARHPSHVGCEFWLVHSNNVASADGSLVLMAGNVSTETPVVVRVLQGDGDGEVAETLLLETTLAPEETRAIYLPPRPLLGPVLDYLAYRVFSTAPIVAMKLNSNDDLTSADASLLLPTETLGTSYLAASGDALEFGETTMGAFVTVVGVSDSPTSVQVDLPPDTQFTAPTGARVDGQSVRASLSRYQVLSLESSGGTSVTGARISADAPVAAFSGNAAAVVPTGSAAQCCADHMVAQLLPLSSGEEVYVAGHSFQRRSSGTKVADSWLIIAANENTVLEFKPIAPQGAATTLGSGESTSFRFSGDFIVRATGPVSVFQLLPSGYQATSIENLFQCSQPGVDDYYCTLASGFLAACTNLGPADDPKYLCAPLGDPSIIPVPPIDRFSSDYTLHVPEEFSKSFITIVAERHTRVEIEGIVQSDGWESIGSLDGKHWERLSRAVPPGSLRVRADAPIGLTVQGLDLNVSYGYLGALGSVSAR